jgi:hypothetical protein
MRGNGYNLFLNSTSASLLQRAEQDDAELVKARLFPRPEEASEFSAWFRVCLAQVLRPEGPGKLSPKFTLGKFPFGNRPEVASGLVGRVFCFPRHVEVTFDGTRSSQPLQGTTRCKPNSQGKPWAMLSCPFGAQTHLSKQVSPNGVNPELLLRTFPNLAPFGDRTRP